MEYEKLIEELTALKAATLKILGNEIIHKDHSWELDGPIGYASDLSLEWLMQHIDTEVILDRLKDL